MNVEAPGVASKTTVVVDRKVSGPVVRSRRTSYDVTETSD